MFTTVQSFAIAGAKFIQTEIKEYAKKFAHKYTNADEKKIKILLSTKLSDAVIENYEGLSEQKSSLSKYLTKIRKKLPEDTEKKFEKILTKTRFFTFIFGVHSALMIFNLALIENKLFDSKELMSYMCLTSLYFLLLPIIYNMFSKNTIKKYITGTFIIFIIFFATLLNYEGYLICLLIVSLVIRNFDKEKKDKYRDMVFVATTYAAFLYLASHSFIDYSIREFIFNIYSLISEDTKYHNFISIVLFTIVYLIITLIVPTICFYTRGEILIKQYKKHRDIIINRFHSLKEIEIKIEQIESNRNVGPIHNEIRSIRENKSLPKNKRDELIATIMKRHIFLKI